MNPDRLKYHSRWSVPLLLLIVFLALTRFSGCKDESDLSDLTDLENGADQAAAAAKRPDASTTVSHIQGDRMQSIPKATLTKQTESSPFRFAEIAKEAGIDFVHFSGMTDEKHFPTANGSGVAVFDYDNDGLLDIYFATGTLLPLGTAEKGPNRLYKNLGGNISRTSTEASGLGFRASATGSSPATSTTTATRTFSCATTARTSCT